MRQELVNILGNLISHNVVEVQELGQLMADTTLEPFRRNVDKAIDFHDMTGKWPEFGVVSKGLTGFVPEPGKGTPDFLTQLKLDLQEEYFRDAALAAANSGKWDFLEELVFKKNQVAARKFISYGVSDSVEEYKRMEGQVNGIQLGVPELDEVLRAVSFKSTCIIAAPPSMMKTSCAISAAFHNAFHEGLNVVYVTMEVPKRNIWWQMLSRLSADLHNPNKPGYGDRLIAEEVKKVLLDEQGKDRLEELEAHWKEHAKGSLEIVDQGDLGDGSYKSLLLMLNSVSDVIADGEIDVVIWDYIQLFRFFRPNNKTEAEYLNGLVRYTDSLCKTYGKGDNPKGFVNVILSQVNRQGQLKIARRNQADLTLLAEINELERSANSVVVLYSDEAMRLDNQLNAQVVKHRDGKVMEEMEAIFVDPAVSKVGTGTIKTEVSLSSLDGLVELGGVGEDGDPF